MRTAKQRLSYVLIGTAATCIAVLVHEYISVLQSRDILRQRIAYVNGILPALQACVNERKPMDCADEWREIYRVVPGTPADYQTYVYAVEERIDWQMAQANDLTVLRQHIVAKSLLARDSSEVTQMVNDAGIVDESAYTTAVMAEYNAAFERVKRYVPKSTLPTPSTNTPSATPTPVNTP